MERRLEKAKLQLERTAGGGKSAQQAERLIGLATVHLQQGRLDKARPLLERALELDPKRVDALTGLGTLQLQQGRLDEARVLLGRALAIDPQNVEGMNIFAIGLGNLHMQQGRLEEAREL